MCADRRAIKQKFALQSGAVVFVALVIGGLLWYEFGSWVLGLVVFFGIGFGGVFLIENEQKKTLLKLDQRHDEDEE
jgi:F0F1-type ATP synthase assembly protein I